MHEYRVHCRWRGSTGAGYDAYDRAHTVDTIPATTPLALSADPAFRGDPSHPNPEQLVVAAAASCQLLSFLAVAARAGVEVVEYDDRAEGVMPAAPRPRRITRIVLRPRIVVRSVVSEERVRELCEAAHRECYVANSLTTEIFVEPTVEYAL